MAVWSGLGINYGHFLAATYNSAVVDRDLAYLKSLGFTKIRVALGWYNDTPTVALGKDIVQRALALGFYVIWGTTPPRPFSGAQWTSFKNNLNTQAIWFEAQNSSNLEMQLGNEDEDQNTGTSAPNDATLQSDIRTKATELQAIYTKGPISYATSRTYMADWAASGIGDLDKIGINIYGTLPVFSADLNSIVTNFGVAGYCPEWSDGGVGTYCYSAANNEELFETHIKQRLNILKASSIPSAYFFTYMTDGGFGLSDGFANIQLMSGDYRLAWQTLVGGRRWFINI